MQLMETVEPSRRRKIVTAWLRQTVPLHILQEHRIISLEIERGVRWAPLFTLIMALIVRKITDWKT